MFFLPHLRFFCFFPLIGLLSFLLSGCSDYEREQFRMQMHQPYLLSEWPDSTFLASLDSLFRNEPLRQPEPDGKAELTITPGQMLPAIPPSPAQKGSVAAVPQGGSAPAQTNAARSAEQFAQRFMTAMEMLRSDPENPAYGALHSVQAGEDLPVLLERVYGPQARQLPRFVLESSLRSVNPEADLSALRPGVVLRLPRLR